MASAIHAAATVAHPRRGKRRYQQLAAVASYAAVLALIASLVSVGYQSPTRQQADALTVDATGLNSDNPSVDQLVAADLAASAAQIANLSVATNASNLSISLNAKSELSQTDDNLLSKPQIVQSVTGRRGITDYTTVAGDSVPSVAKRFGISEQTVRWANNLTSDALAPGKQLAIPGIDGVIYTVKAGDTADSIASKYKVDQQRLVTYNDLELTGIAVGMRIVLPSGDLPQAERPGATTSRTSSAVARTGSGSMTAGNGYAFGYCTYYAYERRAQLGRPISGSWGNASSWAFWAANNDFRVDRVPQAGAVLQSGGGWGGYGHVAIVERVNDDGSIYLSEMNYAGWNVVSNRTVPAGQVGSYSYIY